MEHCRDLEESGKHVSTTGSHKPPGIGRKEMGTQELPDKEYKTIALKMLREIQKNTDKLYNNIKETIQKNEKFSTENVKRTK